MVGVWPATLTMPRTLVLASASPSRAHLLRSAGLRFTAQPSDVDEEALVAQWESVAPADLALDLARAKAESVASTQPPGTLVLGCDSVLDVDGHAFGKPLTADAATERWRMQRGRSCHLITGHWLAVVGGNATGRAVSTEVTFVDATDTEIAAYVASGEPLNVAGAFTLEGRAAPLIARIDGDYSNVIGLSLPGLRGMLHDLGFDLAEISDTVA